MDFWDVHGLFFLFFITCFPRLTLLFANIAFGGVFWWLGWIFTPYILVAVLATQSYADTNPLMVVVAWIWAVLATLS